LDNAGGRREGPVVGPGGRKGKKQHPRPQEEAEDNEYHKASERNARYEEVAGRVKRSTDAEAGKTAQTDPLQEQAMQMIVQFGGGEEEHGASIDRVQSNDPGGDHNTNIRSHS
jgi:hypothetical protein